MKPHVQNEETSVQTSVFLLGIALCVRVFILFLGRPPPSPPLPRFRSPCVHSLLDLSSAARRVHYTYIIYIGAATINGAGHIAFALLLLILLIILMRTRGRSANE